MPNPVSGRLGRLTRIALLATAFGLIGLLGIASRLEPDPRGFGTHEQLGLRPCSFLTLTGRPCPTCGMTTSFSWFVRGRPVRSWQANPAGFILALGTIPAVFWLVVCASEGRPVGVLTLERPLWIALLAAVGLSLGVWLVRLTIAPADVGLAQPSSGGRLAGRPG